MKVSLKISSSHCLLLVLLLLLPIVFSSASAGETPSTTFVEEFNGTALDPAKWVVSENTNMSGYPAYGGAVRVAEGRLFLSSNGSSFPFIHSAVNPFPSSGGFTVEFVVTYTCIADSGAGIMLSNGFPTLDSTWHNRIFTLWAGDEGPDKAVVYIEMFNSLAYKMTVPGFKPSSPPHTYKVRYSEGVYSVYVDGAEVAAVESQERPNMIVLGNPPNPEVPQSPRTVADWGYWGWDKFNVDTIRVEAAGGNDNTDTDNQSSVVFSDHFDGTKIDLTKWAVQENTNMSGYPANGGSITVANSQISLSSRGSSFPCVYSRANPFPVSGDFSVEFNFTYTKISDWGCGLWISSGAPLAVKEDNLTNSSTEILFQLWADNLDFNTAQIFGSLLGKQVYVKDVSGWGPSASTQNFRLECSGQTYTLFIDGKEIASANSAVRPNSIGFGHPPIYYLPFSPEHVSSVVGGWSSFEIDFVKVEALGGNGGGPKSAELTMSASTEIQEIGYRIDITGTFTCEGAPVPNAQILVSYCLSSFPSDWNPITVAVTDPEGGYICSWLPTATGLFTVRASYVGTDYREVEVAKNVSILQTSGKDLFFVESNSTLTSLAFDSTSREISFSVSGPTGTSGYVRFMVSKGLVPDASALRVFLDGNQLQYNVVSEGEAWLLNFEYTHSTHTVVISMMHSATADSSNFITAIIVSLALAAPIGFVVLFTKRRKTKT